MTETEVLERVLKGETECYGQLFRQYGKRAYGLAFHYLRSKEDAMDAVQDAFIKAFQNLKRFDRCRPFGPWLLAIVRNQALDVIRDGREDVNDQLERTPGKTCSPEEQVLKTEVWQALLKLRPEEREAVFLRDYQGHDYAAIAEILKIPLGTVMSRIHRGRKELAHRLKGSHEV